MSAFTLVSMFLTVLISASPTVFTAVIGDLQKAIDGARAHLSPAGHAAELKSYASAIRGHLWWLRLATTVFVAYFAFNLIIIIGYAGVAALAKELLTSLIPARYLAYIPDTVRDALIALHKSLLKIDVQPVDRLLLSAALLFSTIYYCVVPRRTYKRARSVLKDARNQLVFFANRDAKR